jgi:hypothetical protein
MPPSTRNAAGERLKAADEMQVQRMLVASGNTCSIATVADHSFRSIRMSNLTIGPTPQAISISAWARFNERSPVREEVHRALESDRQLGGGALSV